MSTTTTTTNPQHDCLSHELDFSTVIGNYDDFSYENNEPIISSSVMELIDMLRGEKQHKHAVIDRNMTSSSKEYYKTSVVTHT